MEIFCFNCKNRFKTYKSRITERNFCSRKCYLAVNTGGFKKGHKTFTPKLSEKHRRAISENSGVKGVNHPLWKGGVTKINEKIRKSFEYKLWREAVFKRDNYTCVWCLEKEKVSGKLNADHIKPFAHYPELRFAIDNGRTLCVECHKKTDTYLWKGLKKN